jgi:hypothetical protein
MDARVLVGTLHVGEPGLALALESAESQHGAKVTLSLIEYLPKWEAHDELFRRFDTLGPGYEVLAKLDADMRIVHPRLLAAVASVLRAEPELDHIVLGVDDWLSGERIQGIQFWRGGVRWDSPPPDLFTDLPASSARKSWSWIDTGFQLVVHAEDPSDLQVLRYGAHRGLKALRARTGSRLLRLENFARFAATDPAPQRSLALAAIEVSLHNEATGRLLVDGTAPVRAELVERLQERARDVSGMVEAVLERSAALRAPVSDAATLTIGRRVSQVRRRMNLRGRSAPTSGMSDEERDVRLRGLFLAELSAGSSGETQNSGH